MWRDWSLTRRPAPGLPSTAADPKPAGVQPTAAVGSHGVRSRDDVRAVPGRPRAGPAAVSERDDDVFASDFSRVLTAKQKSRQGVQPPAGRCPKTLTRSD